MFDEFVVGAIEVVEDPCVEEFQLLNPVFALGDVAVANLSEVNFNEVLVV